MRPADLPARVDAYAHGTRGRYVAGCRCDDCRASNTRYYHVRRAREARLVEARSGDELKADPTVLDSRGRIKPHRFEQAHDDPGPAPCWLCLLPERNGLHRVG